MHKIRLFIIKKIRFSKKAVFTVLMFPFLCFLKFLQPILLIKFHRLRIDRIGHQILEMQLYCDNKSWSYFPDKRILDLFFYEHDKTNKILPANKFFLKLTKKKFPALYLNWIIKKFYYYLCEMPGHQAYVSPWEFKYVRENNFFSVRSAPLFSLRLKEVNKGDRLLSEYFDCPPSQPIITYFNRDGYYLKKSFDSDTSYHDYRDSTIGNFFSSMELMKDKYFCFRMGSGAAETLSHKGMRIVDYAKSSHRNDFLDVYIFARSKFFIGDNSGIMHLPCSFRKKMAITNLVPIDTVFDSKGFHPGILNNLVIFKKYYSTDLGRLMNLSEILKLCGSAPHTTSFFRENNIQLVENASEEIKDLTIEVDMLVNDSWEFNPEHIMRENEFWKIMGAPYKSQYRNLFPKVGYNFLKNNEWLLQ